MSAVNRQNIISVVKEYGNRLFGFIRGRVPTHEDAEDILQEVWYQFSNQSETEAIGQVSGWLHKVARNKITDRYRKKKDELIEDYSNEDEDGVELGFRDLLLAETTTPEAENLRTLFWQQLFDALEELPEAQRKVFIQNELEEKTFQEIADETGENIKTLISRKGYAVKHLRSRLDGLYKEFMDY